MGSGRTLLALVTGSVLVVAPAPAAEDKQMIVTRSGAQSSRPGPAQNFTGTVRVEMLLPTRDPSRVSAAAVTFEPGARTAWHSHPAGQTLVDGEGHR
jgi:quercetin dioxygenase-like cupin family protein